MSKDRVRFLTLLILLVLSFLSSGREVPIKIALEEVLSIGSLEDGALFQWVGVVADSQRSIYVIDAMDYALKKFDPAGKLLKTARGKGQGPGEFSAPRLLDCSEGLLFVSEQYQPLIKVFDADLTHKFNIPLRAPVGDMRVLEDDLLAVVVLTPQMNSTIIFLDQKGRIVDELNYTGESSGMMMDMVSFDLDSQGSLYLAYNFMDRIEKFDKDGNKIWSKTLLGVKRVERKKISSFVVPTEIVYKDIALDEAGNVYVLGGRFSKNRSRDVYVLNPDGEHLTTFTLPDTSHCLYIDKDNFLYARANEGITLKKYRMVHSQVR